jgi:hypothetical protein
MNGAMNLMKCSFARRRCRRFGGACRFALAARRRAAARRRRPSPAIGQAVAALRGISTMRADFVQTDRNGQRVIRRADAQAAGRIRFQYEKGVPLLIVSDGSALTMIDYEVRQVQRWPIKQQPAGCAARSQTRCDEVRQASAAPQSRTSSAVEVRDGASRIWGHHPDLHPQGFGARRTGTDELGRARFAEHPHDDSPVEPAVRRGRAGQHFRWNDPRPPARR